MQGKHMLCPCKLLMVNTALQHVYDGTEAGGKGSRHPGHQACGTCLYAALLAVHTTISHHEGATAS